MIVRSRLQDWMKLKPKARDKAVKNVIACFRNNSARTTPAYVRLVEILRLVNEEVAEYRKEPGHKQKVSISALRSTITALEKCVDRHTKTLEHLKKQLSRVTYEVQTKCQQKLFRNDTAWGHKFVKVKAETKLAIERKNQTIGRLYSEIEQLKDKLPKGPAAGILGRKLEPHDAKVR